MKTTIVIPARNELYLAETIQDLLDKATGDIEIIAVLDGYWPHKPLPDDKRLITLHRDRRGMRASINSAVDIAKGDYIMKIDGHCMVGKGYDITLQADCDKDWIVIPRRYALDVGSWSVKQDRLFVDYEYLGYPFHDDPNKQGLHAWVWEARTKSRANWLLDETMTFQGSCWFMTKEHFTKRLGGMSEIGYGTFIGEAQEIGLKTWLGGGKTMTNKKTWYAHLWKGKPYRDAHLAIIGTKYTRVGNSELKAGNDFCIDYWLHNKWSERKKDLRWLIERFAPFPNYEKYLQD